MNEITFDHLSPRQRHRKEIIIEFHKLRAQHPHYKKSYLIRMVAKKMDRPLDSNQSNSYIARVVREWGNT